MRHFTKKTVLAVVACMTCLMSFAQSETPISESATLVVSTNDGQEHRILLIDQKDIRFQFYGGNMTLTYEPYRLCSVLPLARLPPALPQEDR